MVKIHFVRHGEANAGFGAHRDPGLSALGVAQAKQTAVKLAQNEPCQIFSSPLRRAQETASELTRLWTSEVEIEPRIAEIPSPISDLSDRARWLARIMNSSWHELPPDLKQWRSNLIEAVVAQTADCVMFSHFVAINLLVGHANQTPEMVSFRPQNASVTEFETDGVELRLVQLGDQAESRVN